MLLYMPLLSVALPLWVVTHTVAPARLVSALFVRAAPVDRHGLVRA